MVYSYSRICGDPENSWFSSSSPLFPVAYGYIRFRLIRLQKPRGVELSRFKEWAWNGKARGVPLLLSQPGERERGGPRLVRSSPGLTPLRGVAVTSVRSPHDCFETRADLRDAGITRRLIPRRFLSTLWFLVERIFFSRVIIIASTLLIINRSIITISASSYFCVYIFLLVYVLSVDF